MIDTYSTGFLYAPSTVVKSGLKVRAKRKVPALATRDSLVTASTAQVKIEVSQKTYPGAITVEKKQCG